MFGIVVLSVFVVALWVVPHFLLKPAQEEKAAAKAATREAAEGAQRLHVSVFGREDTRLNETLSGKARARTPHRP